MAAMAMAATVAMVSMAQAGTLLLSLSLAAAGNHPPNARDQNFDVDEDSTLKGELHATDDDPDDNVTFSINKPPANGTATLTPDGKLTYTPNKDWHGKDVVLFDATDGKTKVTKKAIINVAPVNDPPIAGPAVDLSGPEDKPVKGQVTATDIDKDQLSFSLATSPASGSVDVDDRTGKFTFTPKDNANGVFKFSIKASDANAVEVTMPVTVTITPVNDPPSCKEGGEKGHEDEPLKGKLIGNDVDKGDTLTFSLGAPAPAHGKVDIDSAKQTFTYTGAQDWHGEDAFTFVVTDASGASAKCKVAIELTNVNDPPVAVKGTDITGDEDTPIKGRVTAKDPDGDEMYYSLGKLEPKHGEVDFDRANGSFVYTPEANFHGADKFAVDVGDTGASSTAIVNVTVNPVNDPPAATAAEESGDEDAPMKGKLKGEDVDGDTLTFSLVAGKAPKNGAVDIKSDGSFVYTPKPNYNGDDGFTFEVSDGKARATAGVQLKIRPVNDAPTTGDVKTTCNEDGQARGVVLGNDIDRDRLTYSIAKPPKKGDAVIEEKNGSFTYVPKENENGEDSFTVEVSDGTATATSTVSVAVAPVNDAPVAAAAENKGDEDAAIKGKVSGSDVDKDTLTYSVVGAAKNGKVEMDASSGAYTFTPNANWNGVDGFRYEVSDGKLRAQANVKLTVAPVNDAPEVKALSLSTQEDHAVGGSVLASDIDKDKLTWTAGKPPGKGKVSVDGPSGKVTYTPNLDENGDDAFTVMVSDGNASTEAEVKVAIAPVNDAPTTTAQAASGKEDEPIKGTFTGADVDKDALSYTAVTQPKRGKIDIDRSTGAYTYTPNKDENGDDAFKLDVSDGKLHAQADIKLTLAAVNDAPVPKDLALTGTEDREASGKVLATDVDKDPLTFRVKTAPQKGRAFVDDATGAVRYAPNKDTNGKDAFLVEASDGYATADANVTVDLAPVEDAPVVDARGLETNEDEPVSLKLGASDADGDNVSFKIVTQGKLGVGEIQGDGATLRYTPKPDVHGEDEVIVEASDGPGHTRATIPVRIAAKNDAPTVDPIKAEILEENAVTLAVNARDKDGDPVKLAVAPAKVPGADLVQLSGALLKVQPSKDFVGDIELTITPSDPSGPGAPAAVKISVVNVNDPPVVHDATLYAQPGKATSGSIDASDVDAGDELTCSISAPPRQGTLVIDDPKTGKFTYTANANASAAANLNAAGDADSFRIRAKDKSGASVSATVHVSLGAPPAPAKPAAAPTTPAPVKKPAAPAAPKS